MFKTLRRGILALPRPVKQILVLLLDASFCILATWLAFWLRLNTWVDWGAGRWRLDLAVLVSIGMALPLLGGAGAYRAIFRYSGAHALEGLLKVLAIYGVLYAGIFTLWGVSGVPRSIGLLQPVLFALLIVASRYGVFRWLGRSSRTCKGGNSLQRLVIYGAGSAGRQLAAALAQSEGKKVIGFVDDDVAKQGLTINGLPVFSRQALAEIIAESHINTVILAIPSATRIQRNTILRALRSLGVAVRTLPDISALVGGQVGIADLQSLDIEDLLARDPVAHDERLLFEDVTEKVVLVTGAGGSIGSELCRQIVQGHPKTLLLLEVSEAALYRIHQELSRLLPSDRLVPILGSVLDRGRLDAVMRVWRPETVYHAAAYKHVPLVEMNVEPGIRNNVFGTLNTVHAALDTGVRKLVLISTDKAVRPTNVMGASKRIAELILQALSAQSEQTVLTMVRFGNVLGSSGSVVPLFRKQIEEGGPVTVTHPEVTRYFMTIPEAAQLVMQAGALAKGGEVFLLDMGEPVRIMDLARRMIELSGRRIKDEAHPEGDIEIQVTGLRPGEKLFEELLIDENAQPTIHPRIMQAQEPGLSWQELEAALNELGRLLDQNDVTGCYRWLKRIVIGFHAEEENISDCLYQYHKATERT